MTNALRKTAAPDTRHKIYLTIISELWTLNDAQMQQLAYRAGCHWVTLYNWRAAKVMQPRLDKLAAVAALLGYEIRLVKPRPLRLVK